MTDDLKMIVASAFKTGKGDKLSRRELSNLLIYNLKWFDPETSLKVIDAALSTRYLRKDPEGMLSPTFDVGPMDVEVGYRPPKDMDTESMTRPLAARLLDAIVDTGIEKREAVRRINKTMKDLDLHFPAAAIYVGIECGGDMSDFYDEVEESVLSGDGA